MESKDVIKRFFEERILVSPRILGQISENNIEEVLKKARSMKLRTIDSLDFLSTTHTPEKTEPKPKVRVRETERKQKLSPKDFADFYNKKYETMRELLLKKVKAVSMNNVKGSFSDASVIGMIKEINPQGFVIEDQTGEVTVLSKEPGLAEDDVVGVKGFFREGKMVSSGVVYPDVPLSRKIGKLPLTVAMVEESGVKPAAGFVLTTDKNQEQSGRMFVLGSSPSIIELEQENERVLITHVNFPKTVDPEEATLWLKKRCLPGDRKDPSEDLLLKEVPDILWISSQSKWTKIYKGVVIVSMAAGDAAVVDLDKKEIEFVHKI